MGVRTKIRRWPVVDTFFGFSGFTQVTFALMFGIGSVVCVALVLTDLAIGFTEPKLVTQFDAQWLKEHAFIPNILAGFVGFLVGAPVAAVVLATFTAQREDKVALDRINRLSIVAWCRFRDSVDEFCTERRINALVNEAPRIESVQGQAYIAVLDCIQRMRPGSYVPDKEAEFEKLQRAMAGIGEEFSTMVDAVKSEIGGGNPFTVDGEWSAVLAAWNTLDQFVRLQRLERNLDWMDDESYRTIRKWMTRSTNPFLEWVELHGFLAEPDHNFRPQTMVDAADAVSKYAVMGYSDLYNTLMNRTDTFGQEIVRNYGVASRTATVFMLSLLNQLDAVERVNWPKSASKPSRSVPAYTEPSSTRIKKLVSSGLIRDPFRDTVNEDFKQ